MARYTSDNVREIPDPVPVEMPPGWQRPEPLSVMIQRLVRTQVSAMAEDQGMETFDESNDFEIDEDPDPISPYQLHPLVPENPPGHLRDPDAAKIDQDRSGGVSKGEVVPPQPESK